MTLLGFFLGQAFPVLQDKLDIAIVVIVLVSLVPAGIEWYRHRGEGSEVAHDVEHSVADDDR